MLEAHDGALNRALIVLEQTREGAHTDRLMIGDALQHRQNTCCPVTTLYADFTTS